MKTVCKVILIVFFISFFYGCSQETLFSGNGSEEINIIEDPFEELVSSRGGKKSHFRIISKVGAKALTNSKGRVVLSTWVSSNNQSWEFKYYKNRQYKIISKSSGEVVTSLGNSVINGSRVITAPWNSSNNQLWEITYASKGYYKIESKNGYLALDSRGKVFVTPKWLPIGFGNSLEWKIEQSPVIPSNWEEMEIESKWVTDRSNYNNLVNAFVHGQSKYGYKINVRWGGIPKKYVDIYYDNANRTVKEDRHAFRKRIRYTSNNAIWEEDWRKVQYKGTPFINDSVWFRVEKGDEKLNPGEAMAVIYGGNLSHDAAQLALSYRNDFDFDTMEPVLEVIDYRYRVEFLDSYNREIFELSLDRATLKNLLNNKTTILTEVELEIVKVNYTRKDLERLFELSYTIQRDFELLPSTKSKGEYY